MEPLTSAPGCSSGWRRPCWSARSSAAADRSPRAAEAFFVQIWLYLGFTGLGTIFGYLVPITLGQDYRSQSLRRLAETKLNKPRRVVRR